MSDSKEIPITVESRSDGSLITVGGRQFLDAAGGDEYKAVAEGNGFTLYRKRAGYWTSLGTSDTLRGRKS